ncbi:tyrosine-type recombinase/integrase [bacterium]|nr:tyrosine-type recombinase/integrase [bacterium]
MQTHLKSWTCDLKRQSKADLTLYGYEKHVCLFINWCEERDIKTVTAVSRSILDSYARYLTKAPLGLKGNPLQALSQQSRLIPVRLFFNWLSENRILVYNPAKELKLPKEPGLRIKDVLTVQEVEAMLASCNLKTGLGIRDRAMMEVLYSTGIRKNELIQLKPEDINFEEGIVKVTEGKGDKQRLVPIGERALAWTQKYLDKTREKITFNKVHENKLFLTQNGKSITHLGEVIEKYKTKAGIKKQGLCHLFRHTMATLMLKNGADIRAIQEILGHAMLKTTQRYTHLCIDHLKEVHTKTHPAKLQRSEGEE